MNFEKIRNKISNNWIKLLNGIVVKEMWNILKSKLLSQESEHIYQERLKESVKTQKQPECLETAELKRKPNMKLK